MLTGWWNMAWTLGWWRIERGKARSGGRALVIYKYIYIDKYTHSIRQQPSIPRLFRIHFAVTLHNNLCSRLCLPKTFKMTDILKIIEGHSAKPLAGMGRHHRREQIREWTGECLGRGPILSRRNNLFCLGIVSNERGYTNSGRLVRQQGDSLEHRKLPPRIINSVKW